jgi:hypothetical protein
MTRTHPVLLAVLLVGCALQLPEPIERNCAERVAFYPDEDGDGLGEPTDVFVGCEAPQGWVEVLGAGTTETGTTLPTDTTDTSTPVDTVDTASSTDTVDTAAPDDTATPSDTGDVTTPIDTADTGT